MKKQTLVRDATVMLLALFAAYAMVMLTQAVMGRIEGVAMLIFMLAVFVTSMYTEGYAWGVAASLISVLAVNLLSSSHRISPSTLPCRKTCSPAL